MEAIKSLYNDMASWLSKPFREDMPIWQMLLLFALFLIVAFMVFDMLRILKSWMETAVDTTTEAIESAAP